MRAVKIREKRAGRRPYLTECSFRPINSKNGSSSVCRAWLKFNNWLTKIPHSGFDSSSKSAYTFSEHEEGLEGVRSGSPLGGVPLLVERPFLGSEARDGIVAARVVGSTFQRTVPLY